MREIPVFTMPPWSHNAFEILNQSRSEGRRMTYHLIIIETLRAITGGKPTKDELQKFCKIRRSKFVATLKFLIEIESVKRTGSGTKFAPYVYELGEKELGRA